MPWQRLFRHATLATMDNAIANDYGLLNDAALAVDDAGCIAWLGSNNQALAHPDYHPQVEVIDCQGDLLTPGFIDCHTHLVYAGDRAAEFEQRLNGVDYQTIALNGGGIMSTVRATRAASVDELSDLAEARIVDFIAQGITCIEIKSGYGLSTVEELKMLEVIGGLQQRLPITIKATFLGAHALPPEYADNADAYIDLVCNEMLPAVREQGIAEAVDAFCEGIGFTPTQTQRVFSAAQRHGFALKLHAEQFTDLKGAVLAARHHALSVDHLEYLAAADCASLATNQTVAVLLPGAFYNLREQQRPPISALQQNKVPIAIASDHNPGSSPVSNFQLMLNMACRYFDLTPQQCLAGVTSNAARALGVAQQSGCLKASMRADITRWSASLPAQLVYGIGSNLCHSVYHAGQRVFAKGAA